MRVGKNRGRSRKRKQSVLLERGVEKRRRRVDLAQNSSKIKEGRQYLQRGKNVLSGRGE